MRVAVIVLGDLGRSPRMQYHALALAARGAKVDLVGYAGAPLFPAVATTPAITSHRLPPPGGDSPSTSRLWVAVWHRVVLTWRLLRTLLWVVPRPDLVLVQNPPVLPTLLAAVIVARWRRARLVVDWHNFSHAVLALRLGPGHGLVRLTRWCERTLAGSADHHLVVSLAMRRALVDMGAVRGVTVLYDRAAEPFRPMPDGARAAEKAKLLDLPDPASAHRVALLVTATSWTLDEDIALLVQALDVCETRLAATAGGHTFPQVRVVISGDGPRKAAFDAGLRARVEGRIRIQTIWLAPEDYPRLLAAADLGVCLHRSASGVDLPMKLADMGGCGLPVCVLDYGPVLRERLRDGKGGVYFTTAEELATHLIELLDRFPEGGMLRALRGGANGGRRRSWQEGWDREACAVLMPAGSVQRA